MSDSCCHHKTNELATLGRRQAKVLWIALFINLSMFFLEGFYGLVANSNSLLADSLDMLGDALVYAISLYAIGKSQTWISGVSLIKGLIMAVFGLGVLIDAASRFLSSTIPVAETMGVIGGIALVANISCVGLLLRHRNDNLNMRSTWECSKNDVLANIGVLLAAAAVGFTGSKYPDLVVGITISLLVFRSSISVLTDSVKGFWGT